MKKFGILGIVLLLACMFTVSESFASGVSLTGIGSRATALGGAFRGIANDWSATYWNPAGLTQINGWQFGTSIEFISPKVDYTPMLYNGMNLSVLNSGKIDNVDKNFIVPSFGIAYGNEKMSFALSFFAPFGLGTQWDLFNTNNYNKNYPKNDYDDDLKIFDIHPSFAYQVSDKLSIGVGVSIISADIRICQPQLSPNPLLNLQPLVGNLSFNPTNSWILSNTDLDGDGIGFGGNIGFLLKATEDLQIGASARFYNDISLDGSMKVDTYFTTDQANQAAVVQAFQEGKLAPIGITTQEQLQTILAPTSGISVTMVNDNSVKAKLPLPMNIGVGFSYTGFSNLLLTMDVDFTRWSSWDVIKIENVVGTDGKAVDGELKENWDDVVRIALGLEYSLDKLTLRGAFYTENTATVDATLSPTIPDVNRRNVAIIGLGYNFGKINFNMNSEYFFIGDRNINTWNINDNYAGKYSAVTFTVLGGLEYNF